MNLPEVLNNEGFELKEKVPITKEVREIHEIKNFVSTTLRSYEHLIEIGNIESFAIIPAENNEYEIWVKYPGRERPADRLNLA